MSYWLLPLILAVVLWNLFHGESSEERHQRQRFSDFDREYFRDYFRHPPKEHRDSYLEHQRKRT